MTTKGGVGHVAAHASAGGVLSKLQGGSFGHGFLNAGVMKGVGMFNASKVQNVMGSTVIQAAVGGTLSKVTGGKFANGAVTSAIQYAVNQLGSEWLAGTKEAEIERQLKGVVGKMAFDENGNYKLSVGLKKLTLTVDKSGNVSVSSSIGYVSGQYDLVKGLTALGLNIPGASLTLSNFSTTSVGWELTGSKPYLGFSFSYSLGGTFNPNPRVYLQKTVLGSAFDFYGAGAYEKLNQNIRCQSQGLRACD